MTWDCPVNNPVYRAPELVEGNGGIGCGLIGRDSEDEGREAEG